MICFEIVLNGEVLCVSGTPDTTMMHLSLLLMRNGPPHFKIGGRADPQEAKHLSGEEQRKHAERLTWLDGRANASNLA
jgi:hypothetical protein